MNQSQLTLGDSLFIVLVGGAMALSVWILAYSLSWTNRRISLGSLMILLLLMAIAFGALSVFARIDSPPPLPS